MTTKRAKVRAPKPPPMPPVQPAPTLHVRWICYLLAQGLPNDHVRRLLLNDDLPSPTDDVLDVMRVTHAPPKGFDPTNADHTPSVAYVRDLGLEPFFRGQPEAEQALAVLRSARVREMTEAGVITGVPLEALVQILARQFVMTVSESAIALFGQTFLDVTTLSRAQLRVAVHARVRQAVLRVADGDDRAARRAVHRDARTVAVGLPCTSLSWSAVLLAMGLPPVKRNLGKVIDEMEQIAVARMNQMLARGAHDDDRRAVSYATIVRATRDIREKIAEPNDSALRALQLLQIRPSTERMPTVRQLVEAGDQVGTLEIGPADGRGEQGGGPCEA